MVKKCAKYTLFSKLKQNNNFTFQKSCHIYIYFFLVMILLHMAKYMANYG